VQAAQDQAVRATIRAKWIIAWHVAGGRVECMCVKVDLVPGSHFWMLATGAHGIWHKGSNLDFHGNHGNSGKPAIWLDRATIQFRFFGPGSFNTALQLVLRPHFLVHFV
jgi:hypothetical protein